MKCNICDMEINEKNYNFNSFAFLEPNSVDNILYCPFCGVGISYLGNNNKGLTVDSNSLDEKTLKIIDHAVKLELFNGDFYTKAAKMASSEEISKTFEALGRIELFHAKIHRKLGGFSDIPVLSEVNYDKYDSDAALLDLARKREEHAVAYYEKYKHEVNDKNLVLIFEALANVEREHIIITKK